MFKITEGKGFQMTFENGWTVSVQFGPHNYCENRKFILNEDENKNQSLSSKDAEIAAWDEKGNWYQFENDTVNGWASANEVAKFINLISKFDKLKTFM